MKLRGYQFCLLATVTLTGMALLIIEITAARMLTPYFGNSIFTFSSVISIILAALSLGYYAGGRIADRKPEDALFFGLIVLAGFSVLLLQGLNLSLLPEIAYRLSMVNGPLVASLLLFSLPALFLGMLSPFAIKLLYLRQADSAVGNAAGLVFFWSTLGSIVGSLAAGFVLIPTFGVSRIVIGVGLGLVFIGSAGMMLRLRARKSIALWTAGVGLSAAGLLGWIDGQREASTIYSADGVYEKIVIRDIEYRGRATRLLLQDRNINSGMYLDNGRMAFDYTRYFDLHRLFVPELGRALAIGGGAYSVPKAILRDSPATRVDIAEIEPSLYPLAQRYFGLPESPNISNYVVDGRRFLTESENFYDLIFLDVYHAFASMPMQFTSQEFFQLAHDKLNRNGVLITNYFGSLAPSTRPLIESIYKTMQTTFTRVYLIATKNPLGEELQNFIFIGHRQENSAARIELSQARNLAFAYPELQQVDRLEVKPGRAAIESALLLSDDYAPVEYYATEVIRQYVASRGSTD